MSPRLVILGQITIDDVVPAQPAAWSRCLGGNALWAAAGARLFLDPSQIGVVSRRGLGMPFNVESQLRAAGFRHLAIRDVPIDHLVEWLVYEPDGRRRSLPRNSALLDSTGEGAGAANAAYLEHLSAISPSWEDVPRSWRAAAIHLAPQVYERHRRTLSGASGTASFVSIDPSPHYSRSLDLCGFARAVAGVTALLPSEQEIRHLVAGDPGIEHWKQLATRLLALGVPEMAIKLGARGAVAADARGVEYIPPARANAVDLTGAGDAFCGAYAACRILGHTPQEAARQACIAGARATECSGVDCALRLEVFDGTRA
ncbi:MAG: carbohydrate kinase family protein [Gammaproteobacteria bacterium]